MSKTREIVNERGKNYGHPRDQFVCAERMYEAWKERRSECEPMDTDEERCLRHAVYLILTKLSRAAHNPSHMDTWFDVKGYAECLMMCIQEDNVPAGAQ